MTVSPLAEPGLTSEQAATLLAEFGPNQLVPSTRRLGSLALVWRSVRDPMVLLLVFAAAVYIATGDVPDAVVTSVALLPIAAVGFILERRSQRALDRLRALTSPTAQVRRDGVFKDVPAADLVPGDVISIREGDVAPADGRLLEGANVVADESALTGESMPVEKSPQADAAILAGTTLVAGRGTVLVDSTGSRTEYGRVGKLVAEVKQPPTPLERLVRRFTSQLLLVALVFCLVVAGVELARGRGLAAALIAGVSLAMAAVPEEFPMVYMLYLALGAWRLARRNALVRRLSGVEGLGAASVICSDKTGTLTMGRPAVAALLPLGEDPRRGEIGLLEAALLATEPNPFDPIDIAVAEAARERAVTIGPRSIVRDYGFDPHARYMSHVWTSDGGFEVAAKGALEGILVRSKASDATRTRAEAANADLADKGMRVLGVAQGHLSGLGRSRRDDEEHLRFRGLVAFADPLRPGVSEAIRECRDAGIRVVMITGDHPATALALARSLDMPVEGPVATGDDIEAGGSRLSEVASKADVFARVRPEQKYFLVQELKRQGSIVAMTGDGINDAPALREADIGVAMGQRGTEVARESATLVLLDDNFATIVAAVREGRRIFDNLRRAFAYLVAFHLPLLLAAFLVPLAVAPLLLLPVHLVLLELFVHPAVSLVFDDAPAPADLMRRPPRVASRFLLNRGDLIRASVQGAVLSAGVIGLYAWRLGLGGAVAEARATAFVALLLGQILLLLVERTRPLPIWRGLHDFGRMSVIVLAATFGGILLAVYVPPVAGLLKLVPLTGAEWGLAALVGAACTLWAEPLKLRPARTPASGRGGEKPTSARPARP
ncbi:MAG TPA: cation-transporting P-type ATPase [Patescibacteria group bacterium]|nr:cation-transporting P-type ATPase [Patescibacteria group bacterium]